MTEFIHQIRDEIYFIEGQRNGRYPYSHSLLINDFLLDTGISSGYIRKLIRQKPIKNVLLSHWHEDHIAGNRLLPDAKYYSHELDVHIIEDVSKMYQFYFVAGDPKQEELFNTILEGLRLKNTKVNEFLIDGSIIKAGDDHEIKVIHTPGHSAGHCCFYEINSKVGFFADIDLSSFGPWYAGVDSNLVDFEHSIRKLMNLDVEVVVTSHKGIICEKKNIREKVQIYLNLIYQRDDKILDFLSKSRPITVDDLESKNIIYKYYTEYNVYEKMAEKVMIGYHLKKLVDQGKIEGNKTDGFTLK